LDLKGKIFALGLEAKSVALQPVALALPPKALAMLFLGLYLDLVN